MKTAKEQSINIDPQDNPQDTPQGDSSSSSCGSSDAASAETIGQAKAVGTGIVGDDPGGVSPGASDGTPCGNHQPVPNAGDLASKAGDLASNGVALSPIARLNDALRRQGIGGRIVVTRGIAALGPLITACIMGAVREFDGFSPRNDPYGEHDCAVLTVAGQSVLWKVDYYDTALSGHSPDPANPDVTCRVLTVMLADEY